MSLTKVTNSMIQGAEFNVFDYMTTDQISAVQARSGAENVYEAVQAAVTAACTANGTLRFPAGLYSISAAITFPNKSFVIVGDGPTSTTFKAFLATGLHDLFDMTGTTGPGKVIRGISFEGPDSGVYGTGTGINAACNGLYLDNVWFRGILRGLQTNGSFINCNQCVAEYCYIAASTTTTLDESIWVGWTMYKNETDYLITGDQKTFIISDTTAIGTKTNVADLDCNGLVLDGLVVSDDGTGYTPDILHVTGSNNIVSNVSTVSFGRYGIFLEGAGVTGNRFSNLNFYAITRGLFASLASYNSVSNFTFRDCTVYGIYLDTAPNNTFTNFDISGCGIGVKLGAATSNAFHTGKIKSSVTADFENSVANIGIVYMSNVVADTTGIANIPYQITGSPHGGSIIYVTAVPSDTAYPWKVGDIAIQRFPVAGSPKGWVCTVPGTSVGTLSGVAITGTAGQFSCTATTLLVNQTIVISGTLGGTGTITGYADPTTYYIIATNGTTTFTLSATKGGSAIVSTAGTPTGLTYTTAAATWVSQGNL